MNSLSQLILVAGLAQSLALGTSNSDLPMRTKSLLMDETTNTLSEPNALCGDVLTTGTGDILHKPFEQIPKNERCVWIVAMPGAVGYNVNIQYLGAPTNQPEMGQQLIFTGVRQARSGSELAAMVFPPSTNNQSVSAAQILYKQNSLETSCLDYVLVFKFRRSQVEKWEFDAKLCSDLESYYFNHNDISLAIFQSDGSRTFDGFWLYAYPGTPCDYDL